MIYVDATTFERTTRRDLVRSYGGGLTDPVPQDVLDQLGKIAVTETDRPDHDPATQRVVEGDPEQVDGEWRQTWEIKDKSIEIPQRVTMKQARLSLSRSGYLSQSQVILENMEGQEGEEARIEWEYSDTLSRNHPLVLNLANQLDLSEQEVDDLFFEASKIE